MWTLVRFILCPAVFIVATSLTSSGYYYEKCTSIASCSDCMGAKNSNILDISKCIPILPTEVDDFDDERTLLQPSLITCASWKAVQSKSLSINFPCNNDAIPQYQQDQIADLIYNVKWAFYAFSAKPGDTELANMKIIENIRTMSKAVMGYDASRQFIVVTFRGSDNTMNWISDFSYFKSPYNRSGCNDCSVHIGFLNSYNSLANEIMEYMPFLAATYPGAKVVVTGHSFGGALAALAAVDLQLMGHAVCLNTYGAPRVGESNFVNYSNSLLTLTNLRAVYLNDPVPNLPPMAFNFVQGGTEVHFYSCSTYLVNPAYADDGQAVSLSDSYQHGLYRCLTQ